MNDLLRPALYRAYHAIQPVVLSDREELVADVVGPICESSDFLAQDRRVAAVENGALLAVMSAGAYSFAMASNYCSRPKVAEDMVSGNQYQVIRERQDYPDLVDGESVPSFLSK
jgi:diaminopimelate decarboxylase